MSLSYSAHIIPRAIGAWPSLIILATMWISTRRVVLFPVGLAAHPLRHNGDVPMLCIGLNAHRL